MATFLHKALSYEVRGVLFDVYNTLGPMLPERFYQAAVALGLDKKGVACQTEKQFNVLYRGVEVGRYFTDLWIENGKLLLELKVAPAILPIHLAQAISYLKVTGFFHHVYRRAVMFELRERNINYEFIRKIPISYQSVHLGNQETRLLLVENKVLLIPIAVKRIDQTIKNQLKTRMKHLNVTYCLVANFNQPQLETRIINTNYKPT